MSAVLSNSIREVQGTESRQRRVEVTGACLSAATPHAIKIVPRWLPSKLFDLRFTSGSFESHCSSSLDLEIELVFIILFQIFDDVCI